MKRNIIHRNPLTIPLVGLLSVLLILEAPWWLIVPVSIVLGMRVTKSRDRQKL